MQTTGVAVEGLAEKVAGSRQKILSELRKVIVGQDDVVDEVLMAMFCGGHCLITGVPGLAKTLLVKTLAQILDLSFKRIPVSYTHLRAHETPEHLVCRLL